MNPRPTQDAIEALLKARSGLTREEIADGLGLTPTGVYAALRSCVEDGRVYMRPSRSLGHRMGSTPNRYYHPTKMVEAQVQPIDVLTAYLDQAPVLPEATYDRTRWLLGLVEMALQAGAADPARRD